ncbi:hypothetical protein GN244_ATG20803 [Phytophthora infestans]|uniref:Uncharacterized protein n=1 Tax=Phytophthora infestans TaxID=4787 RepID=A0A833WBZ0_PHYIN|nr:hypothetical protein GN244_ATG20803 [Phytophthora infestans]
MDRQLPLGALVPRSFFQHRSSYTNQYNPRTAAFERVKANDKVSMPTPPVLQAVESHSLAEAKKMYPNLTGVEICPTGRVFPVPSQREKVYFQRAVRVADGRFASVSRSDLTRKHARGFYYLSCDEEAMMLSLTSEKGASKTQLGS